MKKFAIFQIILGMLIILSLLYWVGWVSGGYPTRESIVGTNEQVLLPILQNPARYVWEVLYLIGGLGVIICAVTQDSKNKTNQKRLSIMQIVFGAIIISSLVWFTGWVEWDYISKIHLEGYELIEAQLIPNWGMKRIIWKIASFILGSTVVGIGITQLVKSKRIDNTNQEDKH